MTPAGHSILAGILALAITTPALAQQGFGQPGYVIKFSKAADHYRNALDIIDNAGPLDGSDKCDAINSALNEYTHAVDGFLDAQSDVVMASSVNHEDFEMMRGVTERAMKERNQLKQISYRYGC